MKKEEKTLNPIQIDALEGFMMHCWSVYHEKQKQAFGFYAQRLDSLGVPWHFQNKTAIIAETRANYWSNFESLLMK